MIRGAETFVREALIYSQSVIPGLLQAEPGIQ
jgi:hypothetical protein